MEPFTITSRSRPNGPRGQSGQIIIEYLLLTLVTVGIASLFVKILVSRGESTGALFRRWDAVNNQIGKDDPGK